MRDPLEQLARHLESLRAAGVEHVAPRQPATAPIAVQPAPFASPEKRAEEQPIREDRAVKRAAPFTPQPSLSTITLTNREPIVSALLENDRKTSLTLLAQRVANCTRCPQLASTRSRTVFGVGPIDAEVCFVGEAPGAEEDRLGEPFVGPAGQLLDRILAACWLKREEVFICNILRCRPPANRKPESDEAANCSEYLEQTLELVKPRFLVALGGSVTKFMLGSDIGITKLRGRWLEWRGVPVLCTFHPSYLLRVPEAKRDVWNDMKSLLSRMGRPIPGAG